MNQQGYRPGLQTRATTWKYGKKEKTTFPIALPVAMDGEKCGGLLTEISTLWHCGEAQEGGTE